MLAPVKRERWWGWLVIYVTCSVLAGFAHELVDALGNGRAVGAYGVAGIALGLGWYRLYPRTLVERLRLVSVSVGAISLAALAFGGDVADTGTSVMILPGVLAGLVIAETRWPVAEWQDQRQTPLSSEETTGRLR